MPQFLLVFFGYLLLLLPMNFGEMPSRGFSRPARTTARAAAAGRYDFVVPSLAGCAKTKSPSWLPGLGYTFLCV
jgi:hypothetical protein